MGTFSGAMSSSNRTDDHLALHGFRKTPSLVQWMVTGRCEGACSHCMTEPGRAMPELRGAHAEALLDQVAAMHVDELLITGGEPFVRNDLSLLIDAMRERRIRWSLNTARAPSASLLRAMSAWPPAFAAVSVDGPAYVHDRVRGWTGALEESLRAIRIFAELTSGCVAAGTTVTRLTLDHLPETFGIVAGSGATSWGLHLLVPEGRARRAPELQLSRAELHRLIEFAAAKRAYFPVTMADEVGYCGSMEPLLRDAPFFCGAGRTQCVVLPNGDLTACTTFDPRARVGNVVEQGLSNLWSSSFGELRSGVIHGACGACSHAEACGGGCWLQRRHGIHCYRDIWDRRSGLARSASLAICFGLAACAKNPQTPEATSPEPEPVVSATSSSGATHVSASASPPAASTAPVAQPTEEHVRIHGVPAGTTEVDAVLMHWYLSQGLERPADSRLIRSLQRNLGSDAASAFIIDTLQNKPLPPWPERAIRVRDSLRTSQRSLHLVSLLWRDLALWSFDGPPPDRRSEGDRRLMRETMLALGSATRTWRQEIFAAKLHPFLHRDPADRRWFLSKAGPPPESRAVMRSGLKHWNAKDQQPITQAYVDAYPFASSMRLQFRVQGTASLRLLTSVGPTKVRRSGDLGIFDVLQVPPGSPVVLEIAYGSSMTRVQLPADTELTHPDVLRLAHAQNRSQLERAAARGDAGPLALPALHALSQQPNPPDGIRWRMLDAWLF